MEKHISRKQQTSLSYEFLNVVDFNQLNPYEQLSNDVWDEIFPSHKQPESTELQQQNNDVSDLKVNEIICRNSRKLIAGDVNAGYREGEDSCGGHTPVIMKRQDKSMAVACEEEVYDIINEYDSIHVDDNLLMADGEQCSTMNIIRRPLPSTPHDTILNSHTTESDTHRYILTKSQIFVTTAVSILSLSLLVVIVFLALNMTTGAQTKHINDTNGKR